MTRDLRDDAKLTVLVLHGIRDLSKERLTSLKQLFSLQRYSANCRFLYHYIEDPISDALRSIPFDAVILDTTFLCWRWVRPRQVFLDIKAKYAFLREMGAVIVALPQDDYDHSDILDEWLTELGTSILFSVYWKHFETLYRRLIASGTRIIPALTGYIDDDDIAKYASVRRPFAERTIDVGYRVRRLPANFGWFGLLKSEFGRAFVSAAEGSGLIVDISDGPESAIFGENWLRFLGSCRYALACEGGSSLRDRSGSIRDDVEAFVARHPDADYNSIAKACFTPESQENVFAVISPRVLESALAGCCPVMIEGDYNGYIRSEEHYIPVRQDLSGLGDVVKRLVDHGEAYAMAQRFTDAVIGNRALHYSTWSSSVLTQILETHTGTQPNLMSDWEFYQQREYHTSFIIGTKTKQIAESQELARTLGNTLMSERSARRGR